MQYRQLSCGSARLCRQGVAAILPVSIDGSPTVEHASASLRPEAKPPAREWCWLHKPPSSQNLLQMCPPCLSAEPPAPHLEHSTLEYIDALTLL